MWPTPTTPSVQSERCRCRRSISLTKDGPATKSEPSLFSADRLPVAGSLLVAVKMQVPREGEHEAHHVIGDHVGEKSPHVAQPAGMLDERVEHVMFEAGRRRLHPAQMFARASGAPA